MPRSFLGRANVADAKDQKSRPPSLLHSAVNILLAIAGVLVLGKGVWLVLCGSADDALKLLGAGLVLLFAATIDRFKLLKALGMEAETRDLVEKIDHAEELLSQIRELAEISLSSLVIQYAKAGRWNSATSTDEGTSAMRKIVAHLRKLGLPEERIKRVVDPWLNAMLFDWAGKVLEPFLKQTNQEGIANGFDWTMQQYEQLFDHPPADYVQWLREVAANAPDAPAGARQQLMEAAEEWAPEVDYLRRYFEPRDPQRWRALLGR